MVALEPRVNEEKLRELLASGAESSMLDFKETVDLGETRDRVELAKDMGAMQAEGGYLVLGADSAGRPTGRMTSRQAGLLDESRLRQIIARWVPAPLEILTSVHDIDGNTLGVIYVGPSAKGLCVFRADGQYRDAKGVDVTVFRQGDVFVRDGTQSRRWQQPDIDRILDRIRNAEKERWREELVDDFRDLMRQGGTEQTLARGPAQALTWQLDESTFLGVITEQLRAGDSIPVTLLLDAVPAEAERLLREGRADDVDTLLDRLACLLALLLRIDRHDIFNLALSTFVDLYNVTFDAQGVDRNVGGPPGTNQFRLELIERVMAVGAYAVRRRDWPAVRKLVLQRAEGQHFTTGLYTNWIRHAQTLAARAELFTQVDDQGRRTEVGLLSFVLATISRLPCLHPDRASEAVSEDHLINSVVRFDVLAMLAVLAFAPGDRDFPYYPNFAAFYWHRFEPVLAELIEDTAMRAELHPGDDLPLRRDIAQLLEWAAAEGRRFAGGGPLSDQRLVRFLSSE